MTNYLQPVNGPVRWLATVALGLATLVLALLVIFLAAIPLFAPGFKPKDSPILLGIVALFGVFLVTCSWMFVRLLRGTPSSSGVTILPLWFIRVFGVLFIAGTAFAAWQGGTLLLGLEGCAVGLAMLFVGRSLARARASSGLSTMTTDTTIDPGAVRGAKRVQIIDVPPGDAPELIRRAWVGLELPLAPGEVGPRPLPNHGGLVAGLRRRVAGRSEAMLHYMVSVDAALAVLERHSPEAAAWWRVSRPDLIGAGRAFGFAVEVCAEVA